MIGTTSSVEGHKTSYTISSRFLLLDKAWLVLTFSSAYLYDLISQTKHLTQDSSLLIILELIHKDVELII